MELLQQIVDGLISGFWVLVDLASPIIATLASAVFDVEITAAEARSFTTLLLLVVGAWVIGKAFFGVPKSARNRPMKIELTTAKTPQQVVREDWASNVKALAIIGGTLLLVYLFGIAATP